VCFCVCSPPKHASTQSPTRPRPSCGNSASAQAVRRIRWRSYVRLVPLIRTVVLGSHTPCYILGDGSARLTPHRRRNRQKDTRDPPRRRRSIQRRYKHRRRTAGTCAEICTLELPVDTRTRLRPPHASYPTTSSSSSPLVSIKRSDALTHLLTPRRTRAASPSPT
jgi:hypothetical protein